MNTRTQTSAGTTQGLPWCRPLAVAILLAGVAVAGDPVLWNNSATASALTVYPKVAPATVVVRTKDGHGTGLIVDPEGWIITNHHVIEHAKIDPKTRLQTAMVYLGRLNDGYMKPIEQGIPAVVYKANKEKDLALLKLSKLPRGVKRLPVIPLAQKTPRPGAECVVIGHPAAGMLWTVRSGQVAGAGTWPQDMIDVVMQRLSMTDRDRDRLAAMCEGAGRRKVLISSCGLNPGDSGGPLLNKDGELIGVSFAIPGCRQPSPVHLDKFAYHVHLDEVKAFLAERPESPIVHGPDPWPSGTYVRVLDFDNDRVPDGLAFAAQPFSPVTGFVLDLDQDSRLGTGGSIGANFDKGAWDLECAIHYLPTPRAYYDTDDDGSIDLVLTDENNDGQTDEMLRRNNNGTWESVAPPDRPMIDSGWFDDEGLQGRFRKSLSALQEPHLNRKSQQPTIVNKL